MRFQTRGCKVPYEKNRHCYYETFRKKKLIDSYNSMVIKTNLMWMEETRTE